ncbi:MAG: hypothetical protein K8T25_03020 [Planctomycetia bacterium]|nr:hypothetical protein [Planctomycetia bacterium]
MKRPRFQFRLRTLLIGTAIIAVWLGWWSYKARQQREAVAALRKGQSDGRSGTCHEPLMIHY